MFTGLIEETGDVIRFEQEADSWKLTVRARAVLDGIEPGDSIAVNGCCLTVTAFDHEAGTLRFDLLEETVRLTSFRILGPGSLVNLESSMRAGGKLGGHFVSGHIDVAGLVAVAEPRGADTFLRIEPPPEFLRYIVYKGSIAIDGISLTVAEVDATGFACWIIPHTLEVTNLKTRQAGDVVNLECDMLAKYVEKILGRADGEAGQS